METESDEGAPAAAPVADARDPGEADASVVAIPPDQVMLGTVRQPEPGMLNEVLLGDERELNATEFVLFGNVEDAGRVSSSSLVDVQDSGEMNVWELDSEQLNALVESPYLEPVVGLERGSRGEISVSNALEIAGAADAPEVMSLEGVTAAYEGIGNRYAGPIVGQGEDDTFVQRVGNDLISHRAEQLGDVLVDPERPVEVFYEFDGPSVRALDREQDVSLER